MYKFALLSEDQKQDRAKGPARFVIEVEGNMKVCYGILFPRTACKIAEMLETDCVIRELTETELMKLLMQGWRIRG